MSPQLRRVMCDDVPTPLDNLAQHMRPTSWSIWILEKSGASYTKVLVASNSPICYGLYLYM